MSILLTMCFGTANINSNFNVFSNFVIFSSFSSLSGAEGKFVELELASVQVSEDIEIVLEILL